MNIKKILIGAAAGASMLGVMIVPAFADTINVNFEPSTYTTGVINGQDGWVALGSAGSGCALYDQAVTTQALYPSFGSQSFRISDAITSGCFGDQAFAKPLIDSVGETSATAGSFSVGTKQAHFEMQFSIASAISGSQPGLHVSVSPDRGDGSRMSYLRFEDGESGINVFFDDVQGTGSPANFVETQIGNNLDRTITHAIKLTMDTLDGPSNDVVKVYIDNVLKITGTSWENYYRYDSEASSEQSPRIVKTVIFRSSGDPISADAGKGFLIDNLTLMSGAIPVDPFAVPEECKDIQNLGAPIIGTNGSDKINGTNGNDLIFALGGSDKVDGKGGDDCIVGGDGSDKLIGGNGNDVILGGNGSDSIEGNNGADKLYGEAASDSLNGGNGNDELYGGDGSDSLKGENGNDILDGGSGSDSAKGGDGRDTCISEAKISCEL